jgi:hypothetical protein
MANPIITPIYEYSAPDSTSRFLYTNLPDVESGFKRDRIAFFGFGQAQPDTVPVYRYSATEPQRYHLSTNPDVGNGWTREGVAFHASATEQPNTMPVFQYAGTSPQRYHYSLNPNVSMRAGWKNEGKAFYVFAAQPA